MNASTTAGARSRHPSNGASETTSIDFFPSAAKAAGKLQSQRMAAKDATAYLTDEGEASAWLPPTPRRAEAYFSARTSSSTRAASSARQISRSGR